MKVAVTSMGSALDDQVDPRFGRAEGFVIVDTEDGSFEHLPNTQNLNAPQGAGIQAAKLVIDRGAGAVITNHVGPKAFRTLASAEVKIYTGAAGTVADVIERFKSGGFKEAAAADVEGHW